MNLGIQIYNRAQRVLILLITSAVILLIGCISNAPEESVVQVEQVVSPPIETRFGVPIEGYELRVNKVRAGETMGKIMSSFGRSALDIDRLDRAARDSFPLRKMRAGNSYTAFIAKDTLGNERLDYIAYERDKLNYVLFTMLGDSVSVNLGVKPSTLVRNHKRAVISSSLWNSVVEQDLPYTLAAEMEEIYQWSVDFFGIQKGDSFEVIYDECFVDDSLSVGIGRIWGAKFSHSRQDYYAIPFEQGEKISFWDESGGSLRKQMLKAPLKYSRISSRFSNARLHPIYKVYRPHHGVDYAAPTGTPVHSVADGVVTFKGWGGGGGNSIKIKHPNNLQTGYLHLSRYAAGISVGSKVSQGQLIGYVGSTGDSTGPHLDYRVWRGGIAIDPLKIPQEPVEPISEDNMEAFAALRDKIIMELNDMAQSDNVEQSDPDNII